MTGSATSGEFLALLGETGVISNPDIIATYTTDQRNLLTGATPMVLRPTSTAEVAKIIQLAEKASLGIVPQGGNTSYCGGATPDDSGRQIVLSFERMTTIREIDTLSMTMSVDAGVILQSAQEAAATKGLLLPLSLGAEGSCRIGGNVGTNAGGLSVIKYGMTRDLVLGLEAVMADGTVISDMSKLRKNNTGYDIKQCLIGSEGTLAIVTGAVLRLSPFPSHHATAWIKLSKDAPLAELLAMVRKESADLLTSFEYITARALALAQAATGDAAGVSAGTGGAILLELASPSQFIDLQGLMEGVLGLVVETPWIEDAFIAQSSRQRAALWKLRESIPEGEKQWGGSVKHDISVPLSAINTYLEVAERLVREANPAFKVSAYGHVGDGNIHYNILVPPGADRLAFTREIEAGLSYKLYDASLALGGTFSAEHGVGRLKRQLLSRYGDPGRLIAMQCLKTAFDPSGRLNAGAVVDPKMPC